MQNSQKCRSVVLLGKGAVPRQMTSLLAEAEGSGGFCPATELRTTFPCHAGRAADCHSKKTAIGPLPGHVLLRTL